MEDEVSQEEAYLHELSILPGAEVDESIYEDFWGPTVLGIEPESFNRRAVLWDTVKQMMSGKELFRISLPAVLLEPLSLLERICRFCDPTSNLLELSKEKSAYKRMVSVIEWLMLPLFTIPKDDICHVKPYNPVLGEIFHCRYQKEDGSCRKSYFIGEQVSHHPPISAFCMNLEDYGVAFSGISYPKSKVRTAGNASTTHMDGSKHLIVDIEGEQEVYIIEYPQVYAKGILFGSSCVYITEKLTISCERTGLMAVIDYKSRTKIQGTVKEGNKVVMDIYGDGSQVEVTKKKGFQDDDFPDKTVLAWDKESYPLSEKIPPILKQKLNESRRIWHNVTINLINKQYDESSKNKEKIEEHQRKVAKSRSKDKTGFVPKFFEEVEKEKEWKPLVEAINSFLKDTNSLYTNEKDGGGEEEQDRMSVSDTDSGSESETDSDSESTSGSEYSESSKEGTSDFASASDGASSHFSVE